MAALALVLYGLYLALAFVLRTALHRRRTGRSGFSGISGAPGSAEWLGGVLTGRRRARRPILALR